jgi:hypothetical protein
VYFHFVNLAFVHVTWIVRKLCPDYSFNNCLSQLEGPRNKDGAVHSCSIHTVALEVHHSLHSCSTSTLFPYSSDTGLEGTVVMIIAEPGFYDLMHR